MTNKWFFTFSELNEFLAKHNVMANFNKNNNLIWNGQYEISVAWRQKTVVVPIPHILVSPADSLELQQIQILNINKDISDYFLKFSDELNNLFNGLSFADDDHKNEIINSFTQLLDKKTDIEAFIKAAEKVLLKRREYEQLLQLNQKLCIDDYPKFFDVAASMSRKATVILGPTNSGKTYRALQCLKSSKTGVYLGPLRLLALEVQESLCDSNVPCSLLTGEEKVDIPGAVHLASTIEMFNPDVPYECVVIDEVQMIVDPDRGWAWTQAIVGCPAEHLVLVGSPDAWSVIKPLLKRLNIEYELIRTERLQPLHVDKYPIRCEDVEHGDAFIVFSRKDIFFYQEILSKQGVSTAIIYGALGPEVRKAEAARFRNGDAKVLIATDAIGMGLNLPIKRIVFTTNEKFNGTDVDLIEPSLVKQIAGRAGRFGKFEEGHVTALDNDHLNYIRESLGSSTKINQQKTPVAPNIDQLILLGKELHFNQPSRALIAWRTRLLLDDNQFYAAQLFERVSLCEELEERFPALSFKDVAKYSMAPLPRLNDAVQIFFQWISESHNIIPWEYEDRMISDMDIEGAELAYHISTIYCWLGRAFPKTFPDHHKSYLSRKTISEHLIFLLQQRAKLLLNYGKKKQNFRK